MIPGEFFVDDGEIELNAGRATVMLRVANTGDRPIQVGSHYHFYETNPALDFDRAAAYGHRLDIAAGTAVRFEPGQGRTVELVALAGRRRIYGFRQEVMGALGAAAPKKAAASQKAAVAKKRAAGRPADKAARPDPKKRPSGSSRGSS